MIVQNLLNFNDSILTKNFLFRQNGVKNGVKWSENGVSENGAKKGKS